MITVRAFDEAGTDEEERATFGNGHEAREFIEFCEANYPVVTIEEYDATPRQTITCPQCGHTVDQWIHGICCACHDAHCGCKWTTESYGITPNKHPHLFPRLAAAVATLAIACLLPLTPAPASAQYDGPQYQRPLIGTARYDASCELVRSWEDGSAVAYCAEDGVTYVYDPNGSAYPTEEMPFRLPGWYAVERS